MRRARLLARCCCSPLLARLRHGGALALGLHRRPAARPARQLDAADAAHRRPGDGADRLLRLALQREAPLALRSRLAPFDQPRAGDLGGAADDHHLPRRDHLDRHAPARPLPPARADRRAPAGAGEHPAARGRRWWRSTGSGCSSTRSTGIATVNDVAAPGRPAGPLPPHLAVGDERLLRAGARRDDLRHAGHGVAAPRGDERPRRLRGLLVATTAAPASPACASGFHGLDAGRTSTSGSPRRASTASRCSTARAYLELAKPSENVRADAASATSTPTSSAASSTAASRRAGSASTR